MIPLSSLKKGKKGIIKKITVAGAMRERFLSMGFIPGEVVCVERIAPLGDPIDITIKGYHISLRKKEAQFLLVDVVKYDFCECTNKYERKKK